jgi:HEAT repeat protein
VRRWSNEMANRIYILLMLTFLASCSQRSTATTIPPMEIAPLPTAASTLPELVRNMSSNDMTIRLVSTYKLREYGDEAIVAMPALISNLYVDDSEVRIAATIALKNLGPNAQSATSDLVWVLHNDKYIHASAEAADALGFIAGRSVIPDLATELFAENPYQSYDIAIPSAKSIARITGERFTDFDSTAGYTLDRDGTPLIVVDARKWWQEIGQYQDWSSK